MSTVCGQDLLEWLLEEPSNIASFEKLEDLVSQEFDGTHEAKYAVEGSFQIVKPGSPDHVDELPKSGCTEPSCAPETEEKIINGKQNTYRVLMKNQGSEAASLTSSGMTPGLTGADLGGSRCP
ncbi:hypothetical protein ABZX51_006867 [Aspergillus tubingensis]